jgi:hypothetical protein
MRILNLTQHAATADQTAAGVVEPADKAAVQAALTFATVPTKAEMTARATALAEMAKTAGVEAAMIGGAPFFMAPLETALVKAGIRPLFAFSERRSVDKTDPVTGAVTKTAIFVHVGWVESAAYALSTNENGEMVVFD